MDSDGPIPLPEHGSCFVCGTENPKGMGLTWYRTQQHNGGNLIFADFQFTISEQGPPGYTHGGASAAVLDEAMGAVVWLAGMPVVLANMNLDYRLPVPLGVTLRVEAWLEQVEGKKAHCRSHILLPDERKAIEAQGLYVRAPELFRHAFYT